MPATAPAFKVFPSITEASNSFFPSFVNTAPLPALNRESSSSIFIADSTASIAVPPFFKIALPAFNAFCKPCIYNFSFSGVMLLLRIVPAPPCITRTYLPVAALSCWAIKVSLKKLMTRIKMYFFIRANYTFYNKMRY